MSNIRKFLRDRVDFLKNDQVEIRIRMLFLLEHAVIVACVVGTTFMVAIGQPFLSVLPNLLLLVLSVAGLLCSHRGKHDLSAILISIGGANIMLPYMFFSAGGNDSGMPVWFVFGVVVACMMSKGGVRLFMVCLTLAEDVVCMLLGKFHPELVTPMVGENAPFFDMVQSYATVCIGICLLFVIHVDTYERQKKKLEEQRETMSRILNTDELTNTFNRRAYYEAISICQQEKSEDLVVVMMDVNGLKKMNDTCGHAEGDNLLRTAAAVMHQAFSKYGELYRLGGDEFAAILHCTEQEAAGLRERLQASIRLSDEAFVRKLSVAMGAVRWGEFPEERFQALEKIADERMYADKSIYYQSSGRDRRHAH